jgi:cell division protein FtsB
MDEIREFFSRIKLVRMRTPNLVKVIVTIVIVLCMVALIGLRICVTDLENRTANLRDEAAALDQANNELEEKIDEIGSVQSVVDIAQEELGLVAPGTVIFETGPAPETESSEGN